MATAKLTAAQRKELDKLLTDFDDARAALADATEEIVNDWTDEIDERSEKWQEGEAGQEAVERRDTMQQFWDELPETPTIDFDSL